VPFASVNQPSLSISSPEFVPLRSRAAATSFQYKSNAFSLANTDRRASLPHSADDAYSIGDALAFSGGRGDYRNSDGTVLAGYYVPQQLANITIGDRPPRPLGPSYVRAPQRRDATSQTADVKLVNAGTGGSSVLYVDASTNTPPYDNGPPCGLQQAHVRCETDVEMQADYRTKLNAVYSRESSGRSPGTDDGLQDGSRANRWADCWQRVRTTAADEKATQLFSDASKNHTHATADATASRRESSHLRSEDVPQAHDMLPKSSRLSMHGSCDCMISGCPFASPLGVNTNMMNEQNADVSPNSLATSREPGLAPAQVEDIVLYNYFCS